MSNQTNRILVLIIVPVAATVPVGLSIAVGGNMLSGDVSWTPFVFMIGVFIVTSLALIVDTILRMIKFLNRDTFELGELTYVFKKWPAYVGMIFLFMAIFLVVITIAFRGF